MSVRFLKRMNEKQITVNGNDLTIRKIPLRKYGALLKSFEELPKHFNELSGKENTEIVGLIPSLIGDCYPDFARVINVATGLEIAQIDELGLDDVMTIAEAIIEVNNYQYVFDTIKKMAARPGIKQQEALPQAAEENQAQL